MLRETTMESKDLLNSKLRGLHYEGYNYGVKNAQKTRYGCIKRSCRAKLYINENHDMDSIKILEPHTCCKSTHQTLEKRKMRQILKETAANDLGTAKCIFDQTSLQHKDLAVHVAYQSIQKTIQRAKRKSTADPGFQKQCTLIKTYEEQLKIYPFLLIYKETREISGTPELDRSSSKNKAMNNFKMILPKIVEKENI